jgi:hypothetical protein
LGKPEFVGVNGTRRGIGHAYSRMASC